MRLLLAEDEKELSDALVILLNHSNYTVDAVYNGEDALDYLRTGVYDAAVLDIMMPKMDGLTVVKTIRKEGSNLPILLLTAKTDIDDKVIGLDAGADDYLGKPFSTKELLARIRAITRRQKEVTDSELTFGNLTLNRATFELSTPTGSVRLASKEFQMIEMLMTKPGNVISTEMFFDKVWNYDSEVDMNIVWVYIAYLRRKLNNLKSDVEIKVIRSLGYKLEKSNVPEVQA